MPTEPLFLRERSTGEVGRIKVVKIASKDKVSKRIRIEVVGG